LISEDQYYSPENSSRGSDSTTFFQVAFQAALLIDLGGNPVTTKQVLSVPLNEIVSQLRS